MAVNRRANIWSARIVPVLLIAIAAYTSWAITAQVCVNYLLNPPPSASRGPRPAAAIVILVIYYIVLFLVVTTYFRLLQVVATDPGFVPRGPLYYENQQASPQPSTKRKKRIVNWPGSTSRGQGEKALPSPRILGGRPSPTSDQPGLKEFYKRDVFVCEGDGRPIWCSMCFNWKPDRTHHCSEVGRCVRKMDHFCPWVGGIVSETNFKFFVQFTTYTALLCIVVVIVMAFVLSETQNDVSGINPHWIVTIVFGGLFGLFGIGMSGVSLRYTFLNTTSVEDLSRTVKTWTLAVYLPRPPALDADPAPPYRTISFPLNATAGEPVRTFAILHSRRGHSPFDLGLAGNFKSVMGRNVLEWLLPVKYSPCCDRSSGECQFALGPEYQRMRQEAGLESASSESASQPTHRRRRRRRRRHGSGDGENNTQLQSTPLSEQKGSEKTGMESSQTA